MAETSSQPADKDKQKKLQKQTFLDEKGAKSEEMPTQRPQRLSNVSDSSNDDVFTSEHNVKNQTVMRILWVSVFIVGLLYQAVNVERKEVISQSECMRDYTFIATDKANQFLRDNTSVKNSYIIMASFLMDVMLISFFIIFARFSYTFRIIFAYILFFGVRTGLQVNTF